MIKAIKVLEKRIGELNQEIETAQKIVDEPEMISDYHFAMNHQANCEVEIIELQTAIKILNNKKGYVSTEI